MIVKFETENELGMMGTNRSDTQMTGISILYCISTYTHPHMVDATLMNHTGI